MKHVMSSSKPTEAPRVLVVDDEPLNRELLRRVLKSQYQVEEASDADEAAAALHAGNPGFGVVLCDQLMPGRCGTELAAEVREAWPNLLFILLTGYDDDPQVLQAQKDGVVDFVVPKPWTARGLKELLKNALGLDSN